MNRYKGSPFTVSSIFLQNALLIVSNYLRHWTNSPKSISNHTNFLESIYGSSRCNGYAWKFVHSDTQPNPKTAYNADNYAWYYANRWFGKQWGWNDPGLLIDDGTEVTMAVDYATWWALGDSDVIDAASLPLATDPPANCVTTTSTPGFTCSAISETYDNWLLDQGYACDGTATTPSCCKTGTCPSCNCSGSSCPSSDSTPDCCFTNTCKWAKTAPIQSDFNCNCNEVQTFF